MICDECEAEAVVTLTAAYPLSNRCEWGTYPAPMVRACTEHVLTYITGDQTRGGATPGYLLRFVEDGTSLLRGIELLTEPATPEGTS